MHRKEFIKSAALITGAAKVAPAFATKIEFEQDVILKKAIGYGMIKEKLSIIDKFKLVKDIGFDGIELDSPTDLDKHQILDAKQKIGIEIPSVVNKDHWKFPLSDPNPNIRKKCIASVIQSLKEAKEFGCDTVLVVPGVVNENVNYEMAYANSLKSIRLLIPYAEKYNIQIALENVWNNFLISPIEAKRFVDEVNSPLIGWYFDVGNVMRYGWPQHWIKILNSRIMKIHIKEFSHKIMMNNGVNKGFNVNLLEGDINWKEVMKMIKKVNYKGGWITAEVNGEDRKRLRDIAKRMDKIIEYL